MLRIIVVDRSAESRNILVTKIGETLEQAALKSEFVPRVSLRPLTLEELGFHEAPDICIVGPEIVSSELTDVARIRAAIPHSAVVAYTERQITHLATIEQLARLGTDELISADLGPDEFIRRVVLLGRKRRGEKRGSLILVTSGKGGLGVTTIAAALGDALASRGKKVALIDFDTSTQDLSRFLQVRPYVNENLDLLFSRSRPVTQEYVEECLVPVWPGEQSFRCMPPASLTDELYEPTQNVSRTLLSILEVLDEQHDAVIVDAGDLRGALQRTVARVCDAVIFTVSNDPAGLFAPVDQLSRLRGAIDPQAIVRVIQNAPDRRGLPNRPLIDEFCRAARLRLEEFVPQPIPFCPAGRRWPGSGGTLYSLGGKGAASMIDRVLYEAELAPTAPVTKPERTAVSEFFARWFRRSGREGDRPDELRTERLLSRIGEVADRRKTLQIESDRLRAAGGKSAAEEQIEDLIPGVRVQ